MVWDKSDNRLEFSDNAELSFGGGEDLKVYHNSSNNNSYIVESGTGTFNIGASQLNITNAALNETQAKFIQDGSVELYHNNVKKIHTEAYGVDVTGTTQSDTLIVTGVSTVASMIFSAGTNTNGVSYFDANGQVQSTVAPASGISTSNYILTTNASGVPTWTSTIDCGTF